jgi:hypothetical protein
MYVVKSSRRTFSSFLDSAIFVALGRNKSH